MLEDNDISNEATIDSFSGKNVAINSNYSDSETITIDDENVSLLRSNAPINNRNQNENKEFLGLILMTLSAFAFSTMSLCVKIGNKKYPFFQSVFARSIFQVVGGYVGCKTVKVSPWGHPKHYLLLICRGAFGAIGMTLFFAGMTYLPLADNTVVFFTGPAITAIIAWIILGEQLTVLDGFLSLLSLFGVILVSKPQFLFSNNDNTNYNSVYFLLPLIGASMGAFAYIIVRYIGSGVHYLVHVFYFGVVSTVISAFSLFIFHIQDPIMPESLFDWIIHILIAISAFIGQCLLNRGLQLCAAGPGTLMRNLDVVFAFIFGITILGEVPKWNSITGALIIVGSSVVMGLKKFLQKKKSTTPINRAVSLEESSEDEE
ncbi:hypothetical protein H8356DRAFT_1672439 [Neocallimastix lanati (nom. inval.)]|jgi:drug/metabolite transporter (DMT)-like permease|nr:hypothetical protein H8356DRAFT_1672439 [Neocallimastix sp. JGI-2020a]